MLAIIGDYPSKSDIDNGTVMESPKEALLFSILEKVVKADMESLYKAYAHIKRPEDNGSWLTAEEEEIDRDRLHGEMVDAKPTVIMAMGEVAMRAISKKVGISKMRGKEIKVTLTHPITKEEWNTVVIPVFGSTFVDRQQHLLKQYAEDINKAWLISQNQWNSAKITKIVRVRTIEKFLELIRYVKETKVCCFDYETSSIPKKRYVFREGFKATLLTVTFQAGSSWSVPLEHKDSPFSKDDVEAILYTFYEEILMDDSIEKIGHNVKYERQVSQFYGAWMFRGRWQDTMLMHHLLDETQRHGLKDIAPQFFPELDGWEDEVKNNGGFEECPLEILEDYGCTDTDATYRLSVVFTRYLLEDERVYDIYRNLQMYALRALSDAEMHGMEISMDKLLKSIDRCTELTEIQIEKLKEYKQVKRFEAKQRELVNEQKLVELKEKISTGTMQHHINRWEQMQKEIKMGVLDYYKGINFLAPKQVGSLLFTKDGFGYRKVWSSKKREEVESTGKDVLSELEDNTGFIAELLTLRSIQKIKGTYLEGIYLRLGDDKRIHTTFKQHGTASGRLSSADPNLQNLPNLAKLSNPISIECTNMVKGAFVAPKGYKLVQLDYSQAELRAIAEFANETNMLDAYNNGIDLHAKYAAKMLEVSLEEFYKLEKGMQKQWRTRAKAGNFGLIYGMSAEGLLSYAWNNYGVRLTESEAEEMRNAFFEMYPRLLDYHKTYIKKARKFGYVRTLFGRRRRTPDILNSNEYIRGMDERVAINSPIQGTAGEFTIFALSLLKDRLDPRVIFVNTIHDSIIFYVPDELIVESCRMMKYTCENLPTGQFFGKEMSKVKMMVDLEYANSGETWKDLKEYKEEEFLK